jgi:hypothetical protein
MRLGGYEAGTLGGIGKITPPASLEAQRAQRIEGRFF